MGCFVPRCPHAAQPGDAVCVHHARAEADAVAYHAHTRREVLADLYPGRAELEDQSARRAKDAARLEAIERASRIEWVGDGTDYGVTRAQQIVAEMAVRAATGGRNVALCWAAFAVGTLVANDDLRLDAARGLLRDAGRELGLPEFEIADVLSTRRESGPFLRGLSVPPRHHHRRVA